MAVELCDLETRQMRRAAFGDIKHLEEDLFRRNEQINQLPGDILQDITKLIATDSSAISELQQPPN